MTLVFPIYYLFAVVKMVSNVHTLIICCLKDPFYWKPLHYIIQIIGSIAGGAYICSLCALWLSFFYTFQRESEGYIIVLIFGFFILDIVSFTITSILSYVLLCSSGPLSPPPTMANHIQAITLNDLSSSPRTSQMGYDQPAHFSSRGPH